MPDPPKPGERNSYGETWDGHGWTAPVQSKPSTVDNPVSFGLLDYIPGLRDALNIPVNAVKGVRALPDVTSGLIHNPGATLKGFVGGASEASTPGRIGLLALMAPVLAPYAGVAGPALASLGATVPGALAAGGGEALAQGVRTATDAPNAPQSFPEAAGNVAAAASVPAIAGAVQAVPRGVQALGGSGNVARRVVGAGIGGYQGYQHGGILGGLEGATAGATLAGPRSLRILGQLLGAGGDAAATEAATVAPEAAEEATPLTGRDAWEARKANDFPYQRDAAPTMPNAPSQNPAELFPYQRDTITSEANQSPKIMDVPSVRGGTFGQTVAPIDPRDPDVMGSASMQGLRSALLDPDAAARDALVSKYLSDEPDSAFARLRAAQGGR